MLIDGGETPSAEMATTISREDALVRRPLMSTDDPTDDISREDALVRRPLMNTDDTIDER